MTDRITPDYFRFKLNQITWPPILVMAMVFLSTATAVFYRQHLEQGQALTQEARSGISAQEHLFAQEIYLNRDAALRQRVSAIIEAWKVSHPKTELCIRFVPEASPVPLRDFSDCSTTSSQARVDTNSIPIRAENSVLAKIEFSLARELSWGQLLPPSMLASVLMAILASLAIHRLLVRRMNQNILDPLLVALARKERDTAIAQTTQMLAHDVRKPFSLLKASLEVIRSAPDLRSSRALIHQLTMDVQRSLRSVDSMLTDIMELGTESKQFATESVSLVALVEPVLNDIFRVHTSSEISLEYQFEHAHQLQIDPIRVTRVLTNIVENAVQAIGGKRERLWLHTLERDYEGRAMVEIRVGNSGSQIPEEQLLSVFDSFFTEGKKGGTGLGLAIAKKVVSLHGGQIQCVSAPGFGVEFRFTLPIASGKDVRTAATLPRTSVDARQSSDMAQLGTFDRISKTGSSNLEEDLAERIKALGEPVKVLVVDDEAAYRNSIQTQLARAPAISDHHIFHCASSSLEASRLIAQCGFDLAIVDVDLGVEVENGLGLVERLRARGDKGVICVHSNRTAASDYQAAIDAGSNWFLPKPMSFEHLLKLLELAIDHKESQSPNRKTDLAPQKLPTILVFDDDEIIHVCWKISANQQKIGKIHYFRTWEEFLSSEGRDLARGATAFVDMHFENSAHDGTTIADELRRMGARKIYAATGYSELDEEVANQFDQVLEKGVPADIRAYCS